MTERVDESGFQSLYPNLVSNINAVQWNFTICGTYDSASRHVHRYHKCYIRALLTGQKCDTLQVTAPCLTLLS